MSSLDVSSPGTTLPCPPSPTNSSILGYIVTHRERHRVHTGPLYGGLKTVHPLVHICSTSACRRVVHAFGTTSQIKTAHTAHTLRIATCQAQLLSEARPAPPNCPPRLRPRPITGCAKSYRCACHWTAAGGHHAIPAAMWTVSLVKSNHLSGKQPGEAPPWETMFRCGSSAGWPGRVWKIADLSTLADLIGSLPRSSFGSDQSVLSSVHSDGTHTHTRRDSQASAAVLLCCSATLLLGATPISQCDPSSFLFTGEPVLQLDHPPNPADVTIGAPPRAP